MSVLGSLQTRTCPVCGREERDAEPFLAASIDPTRVGAFSFASRKLPEYMSFRLVRCTGCETVFAAEAPRAENLVRAYEEADYDSAEEAADAARTYARELAPHLTGNDLSGRALEIGTGTGVFLRELKRLGFAEAVGVEPSVRAIAAAEPGVKDMIRAGIFRASDYEPESLSLICCFMTLEHVSDPRALTEAAFDLLRPGGRIAFVTHDYTARINKLMGRRSPIIDIEHMQLFCPSSLRLLLSLSGFETIEVASIRNAYSIRYWLRLAPMPAQLKTLALRVLSGLGLGRSTMALNVGNLIAVARKPKSPDRLDEAQDGRPSIQAC